MSIKNYHVKEVVGGWIVVSEAGHKPSNVFRNQQFAQMTADMKNQREKYNPTPTRQTLDLKRGRRELRLR